MTDAIQILLSLHGFWLGLAGCALVFAAFWNGLKIACTAFSWALAGTRAAFRWLFAPTWKKAARAAFYGAGGLLIMLNRPLINNGLEWVENNYLHPVYITPADTSAWALSRYEAALEKNLSPGEAEIVKRRTRETAARVGSTPLAIYEVAYSECGLNPFCIRKDGIAAGWLQFTRAGLEGLGVSLDEVKRACHDRDAAFIMDVSERYLVRAANGHALPTSTDIYTAVFAPAFVGQPENTILYSGKDRPSYFLNAGLDGHKYRVKRLPDGREKLVWYRSPDGAITINDLRWALAARRALFLKS